MMSKELVHSLEIGAGSATLYLAGTLGGGDAFPLRRLCREIPEGITTLRLDLHAVTALAPGATETLRSLVRFWRETRQGGFRLSFASEHVLATRMEAPEPAPVSDVDALGQSHAALTGMFL